MTGTGRKFFIAFLILAFLGLCFTIGLRLFLEESRKALVTQTRSSMGAIGTTLATNSIELSGNYPTNDWQPLTSEDKEQFRHFLETQLDFLDLTKDNREKQLIADAWGNSFVIQVKKAAGSNFTYRVGSLGPDGIPNTTDDLF